MDQNTAIIVAAVSSALLAGVLTLAGVIIQSRLTQQQIVSAERRKETREVVEKIYKLVLDNDACHATLSSSQEPLESKQALLKRLIDNRENIYMLAALYLQPLLMPTSIYYKYTKKGEELFNQKPTPEELAKNASYLVNISSEYLAALTDFLIERGYTEKSPEK